MIRIAQEGESLTALSSISKKEKISAKYLERIFSKLKKANLVKSEKGISGGYLLARKAEKITVFDIVNALEGDIVPFYCVGRDKKKFCSSKCNCTVTEVLHKVQDSITDTLEKIKLSDLI